jgi:hypothetical protein
LDHRFLLHIDHLEDRCVPSTIYTVTSLADTDTPGTLRNAMNLANANHTGTPGDPDTIQFSVAGQIDVGSATGGAALPDIAANEVVIIDATTAPGYTGTPIITLDGTSATAFPFLNGLTLSGGSSAVKGFSIVNFTGHGIRLDTNGNNTVLANYIGVTPGGIEAGNGISGILMVTNGGNTIGSTIPIGSGTGLGANVISGNDQFGIHVFGLGSSGTTILGNYIGTDPTGAFDLGNGASGIFMQDSMQNVVGGSAAGAGNVISGNGADGVVIGGTLATNNRVINNLIGTTASGTDAMGNSQNGVHITDGAQLNVIGGTTPNATAFTGKPPDGNVISGSGSHGVLITNGASHNLLSGNYIGTDLSGTQSLGNALDGVAIVDADNNSLIGTTFPQAPFVYLNLMGGNGGNGLRIHDSDNTTVHANSFGLGGDNATPVPNALNGVLIGGSSTNTQFGGVIPLGNISSGNGQNGVVIADTASGTVVFNTFCGLPAFVDTAVPNTLDGMLITSTGGNNLIRTNVVSGNAGNGIHISGDATGVRVEETIIGMNTTGQLPLPNGGNGILIDGNAHDNFIGGLQPSVIPENTISANGGHGIAIIDDALNNSIFHSFVGVNVLGEVPFGNTGAGIFVGGSALGTIIGGVEPFHKNVISGNLDGGIQLSDFSQGTQIIGNIIGANRTGQVPVGNQGSGISITCCNNQVGGTTPGSGNIIAFNTDHGVLIDVGSSNAILGNSIFSNGTSGIVLLNDGNLDQPAPVLSRVFKPAPNTVRIIGTLTAAPNTAYLLEFFATPSDTSPGQGKNLLGSELVFTDATGFVEFELTAPLPAAAGTSFTATATDPDDNTSEFSNAKTVADTFFAVGGSNGLVQIYLTSTGAFWTQFAPYGPLYTGGVTVALGDVTGDGYEDLITGAATGNPHVIVFDGFALAQQGFDPATSVLASWFAYGVGFDVGANVAAADVNGDGFADVVTGANTGNPHVKVFSGQDIANGTFDPAGSSLLNSFFAYGVSFNIGVTVAADYINADGFADVATGTTGGNPHVKVFDGQALTTGTGTLLLASWFAYQVQFNVGANVSIGDVDGDGFGDVITGASIGNPQVRVYGGQAIAAGSFDPDTDLLAEFFAYATNQNVGVTVGAADRDGSGVFSILTGNTTGTPIFKAWSINVTTGGATTVLAGIAEGLTAGIYVGG